MFSDVLALLQRVNRDLPKTPVGVNSIESANLLPAVQEGNGLIQQALAKLPNTGYTDIYTPMQGEDGQPRATLFREDMLHMKPEGYAIWRKALASKVQCGATVKR